MKKVLSIAAILLLSTAAANAGLTFSGGTFTWTSTTTADVMIDGANVDTNYADGTLLTIKGGSAPFSKVYLRFDLPDNVNFTSANLTGASLTLFRDPEANATYHYMGAKSFRIYALRESNEGWTESGITYNQALTYYGNCSTAVGDSKYFVFKSTNIDPLYPYDPNHFPTYQITSTNIPYPVDANYDGNMAPSATFPLMGDYTYNTRDANFVFNFVNLITENVDDSVSLMLGPNNSLYFLSKEYGDGSSAPMMTITFVPEPATLSLLVLGAAALLRRRRA